MAGPTKQFDSDAALDKALLLFWQRGYEATSMQDLVNTMGINRASMYQTFGNKQALFETSLERYVQRSLNHLESVRDAPGSALDNLRGLFEAIVDQSLQGNHEGCLLNNTAVELGPHDAKLADLIKATWLQFENIFRDILQQAMDQGEIQNKLTAAQAGRMLNTQLQGLMVKSKTGVARDELMQSIEGIFELLI